MPYVDVCHIQVVAFSSRMRRVIMPTAMHCISPPAGAAPFRPAASYAAAQYEGSSPRAWLQQAASCCGCCLRSAQKLPMLPHQKALLHRCYPLHLLLLRAC